MLFSDGTLPQVVQRHQLLQLTSYIIRMQTATSRTVKAWSWQFVWRLRLAFCRAHLSAAEYLHFQVQMSEWPCITHPCVTQNENQVEKLTPYGLPVSAVTARHSLSGRNSRSASLKTVYVSMVSGDPCFFPLGGQENTISSLLLSGSLH